MTMTTQPCSIAFPVSIRGAFFAACGARFCCEHEPEKRQPAFRKDHALQRVRATRAAMEARAALGHHSLAGLSIGHARSAMPRFELFSAPPAYQVRLSQPKKCGLRQFMRVA